MRCPISSIRATMLFVASGVSSWYVFVQLGADQLIRS
jgi:hypothetical protein